MTIDLKNVSKVIKRTEVLSNISCSFTSGNIYGIKGINGSGKTMLLRVICGLISPTSGSVMIDGVKIKTGTFPESIGILIENPAFINYYSGLQNLELLSKINKRIQEKDVLNILSRVGLEKSKNSRYMTYSLGMKQRLGIAAALMEHPEIIILDEPTNALDSEGIEMLSSLLIEEKKRNAIIIISCHDFDFLTRISDYIYTIEGGKLI